MYLAIGPIFIILMSFIVPAIIFTIGYLIGKQHGYSKARREY